MGFKLQHSYQDYEVKNFETRLRQFMTMLLLCGNQLNIWATRITEYRALQMDGAIVCSDEANDKIDMMEDYIINSRLILEDMTEKAIFAKNALLLQQQQGGLTSSL